LFAVTSGLPGACVSGVVGLFPALAVASSDAFPASSFALAVTSLPSFTLSAGIVTFPVVGSTVTSLSSVVQFPSSPFVTVTVFGVAPSPSGV